MKMNRRDFIKANAAAAAATAAGVTLPARATNLITTKIKPLADFAAQAVQCLWVPKMAR